MNEGFNLPIDFDDYNMYNDDLANPYTLNTNNLRFDIDNNNEYMNDRLKKIDKNKIQFLAIPNEYSEISDRKIDKINNNKENNANLEKDMKNEDDNYSKLKIEKLIEIIPTFYSVKNLLYDEKVKNNDFMISLIKECLNKNSKKSNEKESLLTILNKVYSLKSKTNSICHLLSELNKENQEQKNSKEIVKDSNIKQTKNTKEDSNINKKNEDFNPKCVEIKNIHLTNDDNVVGDRLYSFILKENTFQKINNKLNLAKLKFKKDREYNKLLYTKILPSLKQMKFYNFSQIKFNKFEKESNKFKPNIQNQNNKDILNYENLDQENLNQNQSQSQEIVVVSFTANHKILDIFANNRLNPLNKFCKDSFTNDMKHLTDFYFEINLDFCMEENNIFRNNNSNLNDCNFINITCPFYTNFVENDNQESIENNNSKSNECILNKIILEISIKELEFIKFSNNKNENSKINQNNNEKQNCDNKKSTKKVVLNKFLYDNISKHLTIYHSFHNKVKSIVKDMIIRTTILFINITYLKLLNEIQNNKEYKYNDNSGSINFSSTFYDLKLSFEIDSNSCDNYFFEDYSKDIEDYSKDIKKNQLFIFVAKVLSTILFNEIYSFRKISKINDIQILNVSNNGIESEIKKNFDHYKISLIQKSINANVNHLILVPQLNCINTYLFSYKFISYYLDCFLNSSNISNNRNNINDCDYLQMYDFILTSKSFYEENSRFQNNESNGQDKDVKYFIEKYQLVNANSKNLKISIEIKYMILLKSSKIKTFSKKNFLTLYMNSHIPGSIDKFNISSNFKQSEFFSLLTTIKNYIEKVKSMALGNY